MIYKEAASGAEDGHDFPPPREYLGVYLERRRESGFQLYNTLGIARGDKAAYAKQALENYNFFGAPHVAIIHTDEPLGVYGAVDCGAYVGNFMLAAQALGLGTIPQAALARHSKLIRRHFNLADDRRVVCGISFGYADHDHKVNSYRTSRASVADTVTFVTDSKKTLHDVERFAGVHGPEACNQTRLPMIQRRRSSVIPDFSNAGRFDRPALTAARLALRIRRGLRLRDRAGDNRTDGEKGGNTGEVSAANSVPSLQ